MKYKESYMRCETLKELEEEVKHDIFVATTMIGNPDRVKIIVQSAEEVANLKFKENEHDGE